MNKGKLLEKILFLNKHKQEQASIIIAKLNASKIKQAQVIKINQQNIYDITTKLSTYKQSAYQDKLTNVKVSMIEIRKIAYDMEQIRADLAESQKTHTELNNEYEEIGISILAEQAKMKALFIKEAKFEYIIDMQVA